MSKRRWLGLLPVLCALAVVWPANWGGQVAYVTTHGISMEPRFHTGDLAVVHPEHSYRVGDVAAYHNRMLHTVVLHRIVALSHGHYTFKGDNNSWLDPERPVRSQLIGTLVLRVPHGGVWLHRLLTPTALGLLAFGLLAAGGGVTTRRRKRRTTMSRHAAAKRPRTSSASFGRPFRAATLQAVAAAVLLATLTGFTWTRPDTESVTQHVRRAQSLTLSYDAQVEPSAAYPGTLVTAPTPVFRKVARAVELQLVYQGAPGRIVVDTDLSTPGGWSYRLPLVARTGVDSDSRALRASLDLAAIDKRAQAAARVTGLPSTPVTVTVYARVTDAGDHVFESRFPFTLTPLSFTAITPRALRTTSSSTAETAHSAPATLHLLHRRISVTAARRLAALLLLLSLLAAATLLAAARRARGRTEPDEIARRWRELLLDVQPFTTPPGRPVVDMPSFSGLVRLAQRYDTLILHWSRSGVDTYVIQDDTTVFRYRSPRSAPATVDVAVAAAKQ